MTKPSATKNKPRKQHTPVFRYEALIDLWSRAVIGWSMSSRMTAQLASDALQMALWRRKRQENVIVHIDRGGQYCSADYQALLKRHNLRGSMSAKGYCYDNACAESFFHSLAPSQCLWWS